jgi:uncharacterized protein (UPF0276 family)
MPANKYNGFSDFGIGIGLRTPHYQHILAKKPSLDWFEIISENFMVDDGRPLEILDAVLAHYPVIQHGVSLYFGSTSPLNYEQLRKLKRLVKRTKTPFVSDHLCWGSVDGTYTHDLLPMPYTWQAVKHTAERIKAVQDYLEVPVCVENVSSYAEFLDSQMSEWQFLAEVTERADCGILLDVNNIYVSAFNHEFDPYQYLLNIPFHRVAQIHIAGHSSLKNYLLDTHTGPVKHDVWQLYAEAIKLIGPTNTLLEWDAHIPSFDVVRREALKAKRFLKDIGHDQHPQTAIA